MTSGADYVTPYRLLTRAPGGIAAAGARRKYCKADQGHDEYGFRNHSAPPFPGPYRSGHCTIRVERASLLRPARDKVAATSRR